MTVNPSKMELQEKPNYLTELKEKGQNFCDKPNANTQEITTEKHSINIKCSALTVLKFVGGLIIVLVFMQTVPMYHHGNNEHMERLLINLATEECNSIRDINVQDVQKHSQNDYPKLVHHLYGILDNSNTTAQWKANMDFCKESSPDFVHIFWSKLMLASLIDRDYSWLKGIFNVLYQNEKHRITVAKYVILYQYGGVFIGVNTSCSAEWPDIYDNIPSHSKLTLAAESLRDVNESFILAKPCSNFLITLLAGFTTYGKYIDADNKLQVISDKTARYIAGPQYLSWKVREHFHRLRHQPTITEDSVYVIPKDGLLSEYFTFSTHHPQHSGVIVIYWGDYYVKLICVLLVAFVMFGIVCVAK